MDSNISGIRIGKVALNVSYRMRWNIFLFYLFEQFHRKNLHIVARTGNWFSIAIPNHWIEIVRQPVFAHLQQHSIKVECYFGFNKHRLVLDS